MTANQLPQDAQVNNQNTKTISEDDKKKRNPSNINKGNQAPTKLSHKTRQVESQLHWPAISFQPNPARRIEMQNQMYGNLR